MGRGSHRVLWWMLAPFLVGSVGLVLAPAVATVVLALFDYDLIRPPSWVGLGNFRALLDDNVFRISLRNSMAFAAIAVPLRLGGALALALLLHHRRRGFGAYRAAALLPTVVPDVAYGLVWLWLLNPLYGPVNLALGAVGAPMPAWLTEPAAAQAAVIVMSLFTVGEGFLILLAARSQVPAEVYDLARLDSAGALVVFRRITLPFLAPTLALLAARDTIFAFQASFVPALVVTDGGPPPFSTTYLPVFVYRTAFEYLRYGYAAAATVAMLAVTGLMLLVQASMLRRRRLFWV